MSNGDDSVEWCCAAGICCGGDDEHKRINTLAGIIKNGIGKPGPYTSAEVAAFMVEHFDLQPKSWGIGKALLKVATIARKFPYTG